VVDSEHVRAAVTVALDASLEKMIDEITRRVLAAMRSGNAEPRLSESRLPEPRFAESRLLESRLPESRFAEPRLSESRLPEPRFARVKIVRTETRGTTNPAAADGRNRPVSEPVLAPPQSEPPRPVAPLPAATKVEPVRRVTPLRIRSGSILGLDISRPEPPPQDPE